MQKTRCVSAKFASSNTPSTMQPHRLGGTSVSTMMAKLHKTTSVASAVLARSYLLNSHVASLQELRLRVSLQITSMQLTCHLTSMGSPTLRLVGIMTTTTKENSSGTTLSKSTKSGLPRFHSSHSVIVSTILPLMKKDIAIHISKESSKQVIHTLAYQKQHSNKSNIISCVSTPLWSAVIETDGASVTSKMQNASGFLILK